MKKNILFCLMLFALTIPSLVIGQSTSGKIKKDIAKTLARFYAAAQQASTEGIMSLFDTSGSIMFVGGDSAEIWKGEAKIREHLDSMFPQ